MEPKDFETSVFPQSFVPTTALKTRKDDLPHSLLRRKKEAESDALPRVTTALLERYNVVQPFSFHQYAHAVPAAPARPVIAGPVRL